MNVLINLFSKKMDENSFEIYSEGELSGFKVFNYHFHLSEMFPDILEAIVNQIVELKNRNIKELNIVLQTNIADLAHFSSKVYSELIDGVIILVDEVEFLTDLNSEYIFINKIVKSNYKAYRKLKVFLKEKKVKNQQYLLYLFNHMLFNDIAPIREFQLNPKSKMNHNYIFVLDEGEYSTSVKVPNNSIITIKCKREEVKFNVNELIEPFGLLKALNLLLELDEILPQLKHSLMNNFKERVLKQNKNEEYIKYIIEYIAHHQMNLEHYIDYNCLTMHLGDRNGLKRIYQYIDQNINSIGIEKLHVVITNTLFYVSKINQKVDADIVHIRLKLVRIIRDYWKARNLVLKKAIRKENHLAIVTGQFLTINHAPTKWTIDYVNALRKYNPDLKIKIFVDDWSNYSPNELSWLNAYQSANSKNLIDEHKKYLDSSIEIHYSDSKLIRKDRLVRDINAILDFGPSLIYKIGSKYNVATDILFDDYPVVSHTMGGAEDSDFVDVFTGGYRNNDMYKMYEDLKIKSQEYSYHRVGVETPKSNIEKFRTEYGLSENDFILITVGNRLEAEISEDFVKTIDKIVNKDEEFKWVIVGITGNKLIEARESLRNKIKFIPYEQNLFDLYKICDVYVNPIRQAGGNSAALAMKAKLPIITTNPVSDVGDFAGRDNCISLNEYENEIDKLKNDKGYYKRKSLEMFNRIEKEYSFENTVEDLFEIFKRASSKFEERVGLK